MSKTATVVGAVGLALLAVILAVQLLLVVPGVGTAPAGQEQTGIIVIGEGKSSAEPDVAMVTVGVETRHRTAEGAAEENKSRMMDVMQALQDMQIPGEDIRTVDFRIQPEIDWDDEEPRVIGYVVANSVLVKIRQVGRVGDVLDAVTDAGANTIHGVQFSIDDPSDIREQARAEAMADAKSRAAQLAELAGVGLGKPRVISESFVEEPPVYLERVYALGAEGGGGPVPISPGQLEVRVQLEVTFDIR